MATTTLLSQTGSIGPGSIVSFPGSDNIRTIQFNPQNGVGFSGAIVIEGSFVASPGSNDFQALATVTFTGCTTNFSLDIQASAPWIRARVSASTVGAIAVFGTSRSGSVAGGQSGSGSVTITVDSALPAAGTGTNYKVNSPVVPRITTDDVIYANNFSFTLTDYLDGIGGATGFQSKIGTGNITANQDDINLLTGLSNFGMTNVQMQKLSQVTASVAELNRLVGVTRNIQTQLNTIRGNTVAGLVGTTVSAATLNAFFNVTPTVNMTAVNHISGLTATAADLNVLTGHAADFIGSDLVKLGDITASAADINRISGFTGISTDLNKIVGLSSSSSDLNAIAGLAGTGVTRTQLGFLSGLSQNVQSALNLLPNLVGLTASVGDLNTLSGIFNGSGAYPAQISATEISYLNGVSRNIQTQLNAKRSTSVAIGIAEISGSSITITELNYSQGLSRNIQSQLNAINASAITPSGGTFSGPVRFPDGSAGAPSIRFSNSTTTGIYRRNGGSFIGHSVAGVRVASFDANFLVLGTGAANGSPSIRGAGFARTDPVYSFTGDLTTGMYRAGTNSIGFAANAISLLTIDAGANTTTLGGAAAQNHIVTVSGLFQGIKQLGRVTKHVGLSTGATGATTIYTVPTGRTAIVTMITVRITTATIGGGSGSPAALRLNMGVSAAYNHLVDNTNNVTVFNPGAYRFSTAGQVIVLGTGANAFTAIAGSSGASYQAFAAATALAANCTVQAQFDAFDLDITMFGYEF